MQRNKFVHVGVKRTLQYLTDSYSSVSLVFTLSFCLISEISHNLPSNSVF